MSLTLPPPVIEGIPVAAPERGRQAARRRLAVGSDVDAPWVRPALIGLLLATAVLYLWDLGASG